MQQLIAMIIGLALYGGLSSYIDTLNLHGNPLAYRLYYIAIVIPLFFGVVYGPWFGVVTAVGGYLLGHYLAGSPSPWNNVLGIAITGFIAGLAAFKTRGHYNKFSSIAIAEFFGAMGIIVGEGFIDCSNIQLAQATIPNAASDFFTFSFFGLLAGLILLPILLAIYNRVVERRGQRQT